MSTNDEREGLARAKAINTVLADLLLPLISDPAERIERGNLACRTIMDRLASLPAPAAGEAVAWILDNGHGYKELSHTRRDDDPRWKPLYAAPQAPATGGDAFQAVYSAIHNYVPDEGHGLQCLGAIMRLNGNDRIALSRAVLTALRADPRGDG